ncbi:MAG TPA: sugar transferase [Methylomirabilota bacterium]|jgi:exopolysaccharide biosynthesis polyprenyl glycosylphosphotransferase|nr:sugar transferase [Methylomirabilota bacterium]
MLGKRRAAWALRLLAADGLVLLGSFVVAYHLRVLLDEPLGRRAAPLGRYLWLLQLILPVWIGLLAALGAYGVRWTTRSRAWLILRVSAVGLVLVTAGLFLVKESEVNRSVLALFAAVSAVALWSERGLIHAWLRRAGHGERWSRLALVVGTDERAKRLVSALKQYPEAGWVVRACLSLDPAAVERTVADTPVIGSLGDLPDILQGEGVVDEVFFAVPPERLGEITDALETCESLGVDTRVLVDLYRPAQAHPFVEELFALPFYGFSPTLTRQGVLAAKRLLDIAGASALLLAGLPLFLLIALAIKLTSRGPIIFRQARSGFHGRHFWMYKFRTMVEGAERMRDQVAHLNEMSGPVFKAAGDPRLTAVGRFLRKLSLDELPQLCNVLTGEMSLVGPRPLPVYEASRIKGAQRRRLAMRPGMTGLWQVSGRNAVDFDGWMQLDLFYVDRWSLGLDVKILLRTIPVVLRGEGAS